MKKILLTIVGILTLSNISHAQLNILPNIDGGSGSEVSEIVQEVTNAKWGTTMDTYYRTATKLDQEGKVGQQIASGVMTRNTIMGYAAYLVRFISQLGLLVWAMMIIWAGYEHAMFVFNGNTGKWSERIRNAITGVIIIIFSYAIMRIVTTAFLA